ncbi:MAG: nfxB [Pseudomonas sp.]|nr:nfxB [Pseudomonas sp.]
MLRVLAQAMGTHPRSTLKELAQLAGISKTTLHRFCSTRENLVEMLLNHASEVLSRLIQVCELDSLQPVQALRHLVSAHLEQHETIRFLMFQIQPDTLEAQGAGGRWQPYFDALDVFFLRGQREGTFRIDLSAAALTELFTTTVWAVIDAERRGRIARATSGHVIESFFLSGAAESVQQGQSVTGADAGHGDRAPVHRVLIVGVQGSAVELLASQLEMFEFLVEVVVSAEFMQIKVRDWHPHVVVLDSTLTPTPIKRLRSMLLEEHPQLPVLCLSASIGENDIDMGASGGMHDHLPAGSDIHLLLARIRRLLRHARSERSVTHEDEINLGQLVVRLDQRTVSWRGTEMDLGTSEYRVLEVLARYAGVTLSREELIQRVRGIAFDQDDRTIDVAISKLRRKFGDPPGKARKIKTVWGRGYVLDPAEWVE